MFEETPLSCKYIYPRLSSRSSQENFSLESQKQEFLKLKVPEKKYSI